jgi:hypothetical protein
LPILAEERERIADHNAWSTLCGSSLCEVRCRPGAEAERQADALFDAMSAIAAELPAPYARVVAEGRERWEGSRPRPIDRLRDALDAGPKSQLELGLSLAHQHRASLDHER